MFLKGKDASFVIILVKMFFVRQQNDKMTDCCIGCIVVVSNTDYIFLVRELAGNILNFFQILYDARPLSI